MKTPEEALIAAFPKWSGYITPGEIVQALNAAGYAIVPKEPTKEMIYAAENALEEYKDWTTDSYGTYYYYESGAARSMYLAALAVEKKEPDQS